MERSEARDNLISNFHNNPDCIETEKATRGLIMDSAPTLKAEKNILISLYCEGLIDELKADDNTSQIIGRYRMILTRDYGYSKEITDWCLETWICILREGLGWEINPDIQQEEIQKQITDLIAVKSEYERLLEEIENLRTLIVQLTTEKDDLVFRECRDLAAEYDAKIGELEMRVLEGELRIQELKRIIEILQAQINRQEKRSEKKARETAHKEYEKFQEELHKKAEEAKKNQEYREEESEKDSKWEEEQGHDNGETDPDTDKEEDSTRNKYKSRSDELKARYRKIVKCLHPDMNPEQTETEKELFREAVDAYDRGDLDKLRAIEAITYEKSIDKEKIAFSGEDIEKLKEIIEGLKLRVDELQEEIEEIKTSFPYTMKAFLQDEDAVADKQKTLANIILEYDEQAIELEKRIDEMIHGKQSSEEK